MNPNYFNIISEGLRGELELLSNAEALRHLENYRSNFLLDKNLAQCYLNRFASRPDDSSIASKAWAIEYLAGKCLQFSPFSLQFFVIFTIFFAFFFRVHQGQSPPRVVCVQCQELGPWCHAYHGCQCARGKRLQCRVPSGWKFQPH